MLLGVIYKVKISKAYSYRKTVLNTSIFETKCMLRHFILVLFSSQEDFKVIIQEAESLDSFKYLIIVIYLIFANLNLNRIGSLMTDPPPANFTSWLIHTRTL